MDNFINKENKNANDKLNKEINIYNIDIDIN